MARFEIDQRQHNAIDRFNAVMQPVLDALRERCAGRPLHEVRETLATEWGATAGKALPEPYLTNWATRISDGRRIVL